MRRLELKTGTTKLDLVLNARRIRLGEYGKELEEAEREWEEAESGVEGTKEWKERERLEGKLGKDLRGLENLAVQVKMLRERLEEEKEKKEEEKIEEKPKEKQEEKRDETTEGTKEVEKEETPPRPKTKEEKQLAKEQKKKQRQQQTDPAASIQKLNLVIEKKQQLLSQTQQQLDQINQNPLHQRYDKAYKTLHDISLKSGWRDALLSLSLYEKEQQEGKSLHPSSGKLFEYGCQEYATEEANKRFFSPFLFLSLPFSFLFPFFFFFFFFFSEY